MIDGAIAYTWAMSRATSYMYDREDRQARELEDHAREGKAAYGAAAEKAAGLAGRELSAEQRESYGSRITGRSASVLVRRMAGYATASQPPMRVPVRFSAPRCGSYWTRRQRRCSASRLDQPLFRGRRTQEGSSAIWYSAS